MKKILNESGHERNRNAGDEAYFAAMVELFREHLGEVQITAFSDRPKRDWDRYGVKTVYSGGSLFKTLKSSAKILREIVNCDIYVWGSGQILRDDTGIKSPLYRLSRPLLAKMFGKPVMAYAVGIGPLDTRIARLLAKHVLNTYDLITVREEYSKKLLESLAVTKPRILSTVDPAFGLRPASAEQVTRFLHKIGLETDRRLVGIAPFGPAFRGVRSVLPAKYQVKFDMWKPGGKEKYLKHVETMGRVCDYIAEEYDARLMFIAQDASWQGLDDRISADIIASMRNQSSVVSVNSDDYPPSLMKAVMKKMEFVIGGRMHTLILSSGACTPVLGICFEQKIKAFFSVIGQEEYSFDVKGSSEEEDLVLILIERLWTNRRNVRRELNVKMKELRNTAMSNALLLGEILRPLECQQRKRSAAL